MNIIDSFTGPYVFLSNFYVNAPFMWQGIKWPTAEHAYQASKATSNFDRNLILFAETPGRAKRMGRRIPCRSDWLDVRVDFMRTIIACKFDQNADIKQALIDTGDAMLIEGNDWGRPILGAVSRQRREQVGTHPHGLPQRGSHVIP